MREIKFRVWCKQSENMNEVERLGFNEGQLWYVEDVDRVSQPPYFIDDNDFVLMQYTGLTDQANNEIYIGDIVALSGPYAKFEVIINPFTQIPVIDSEQGMENLYSVYKDVIVIGNIYENPGLLEGDKN